MKLRTPFIVVQLTLLALQYVTHTIKIAWFILFSPAIAYSVLFLYFLLKGFIIGAREGRATERTHHIHTSFTGEKYLEKKEK